MDINGSPRDITALQTWLFPLLWSLPGNIWTHDGAACGQCQCRTEHAPSTGGGGHDQTMWNRNCKLYKIDFQKWLDTWPLWIEMDIWNDKSVQMDSEWPKVFSSTYHLWFDAYRILLMYTIHSGLSSFGRTFHYTQTAGLLLASILCLKEVSQVSNIFEHLRPKPESRWYDISMTA